MKQLLFFSLILELFISLGCSPFASDGTVEIMSWNVQNLFDGSSNGGEYPEFNPANGTWNGSLFHDRLEHLSEIIIDSCGIRGPDILILEEVENQNCIEELNKFYLSAAGYRNRYVSNNESGIQTAILTRCRVKSVKSHRINEYPIPSRPTYRDILEVEIELPLSTILIFINHWKSKRGGALETEALRIQSARFLMDIIKERRADPENQDKGIIICGDLNENYDQFSRWNGEHPTALMPYDSMPNIGEGRIAGVPLFFSKEDKGESIYGYPLFYSPWGDTNRGEGSYFYKEWETIDHFLLDSIFLNGTPPLFLSFSLIKSDKNVSSKGTPLKWITRFKSGYSDHFPILLRIR